MNEEYIIFNCPHCKQIVQVLKKEFNCKIFRHGIYKNNLHLWNFQMNTKIKYYKKKNLIK